MTAKGPQRNGYDLAVVGAGVIGLACAWRAAQAGLSVVVLERDEPGAGASGVAAGMLAPVTEADFGEQELLALNLEGRALWRGFAAELEERTGLPTGYAESGALVVAADRDDAEELRRLHEFQQRLGLEAEWLRPRAARGWSPGCRPRIGGAICAPGDGAVEPARGGGGTGRTALVGRGRRAAERRARSRAGGDGGRVTGVRLAGGETSGRHVLIAARRVERRGRACRSRPRRPAVRPVKGQLLELRVRRGQRAAGARG